MKDDIKEKDIRDFEKCAKKLSDINDRIRSYNSCAYIYIDMDTMFLCGNDKNKEGVTSILFSGMDCGGEG